MVKYTINEKDQKVSCVILVGSTKSKTGYVGRSRCNPCDKFDVEFGKNLAYKRALLKMKKAETLYHKNSLNEMHWFIEAERQYRHHTNAYTHNKQRAAELKAEIAKMLGE